MKSKRLSQETKQTFLERLPKNKNGVVKEARINTSNMKKAEIFYSKQAKAVKMLEKIGKKIAQTPLNKNCD